MKKRTPQNRSVNNTVRVLRNRKISANSTAKKSTKLVKQSNETQTKNLKSPMVILNNSILKPVKLSPIVILERMKLRRLDPKNYRENDSSLNMTQMPVKNKLPVYKQLENDKDTEILQDLYEFKMESPEKSFFIGKQKSRGIKRQKVKKKAITRIKPRKKTIKIIEPVPQEDDDAISSHEDENVEEHQPEACINDENNTQTTNQRNHSKITIIEDIVLDPLEKGIIETPTNFKKPNANSTMINCMSPWRYSDMNIRRNPHFIRLKQSALPNIDQETILDYESVIKLDEAARTPKRLTEPRKTSVQKSILDYMSSHTKEEEKENIQSSLFDNNNYSPIKIGNRFSGDGSGNTKRNVLTPRSDNIIVQKLTTPLKSFNDENDDDSPFFGFDDSNSVENNLAPKGYNKPFRLSQSIVKSYGNKSKRLKDLEPNYESHEDEPDKEQEHSNGTENQNESDEAQHENVGLFEDLGDLMPKRAARKRKLKWMQDENDTIKKKKYKETRTKEEQEAFDKWAESFNSMCQDVDNFTLEIE